MVLDNSRNYFNPFHAKNIFTILVTVTSSILIGYSDFIITKEGGGS